MSEPTFAMLCCACGAEKVIKDSIAQEGWRLAFSRPGFVTAKHDQPVDPPRGVFIRTSARSIGQTRSESGKQQVSELTGRLQESSSPHPFDQLHVWPKDRAPIGRFGFEPGIDEVSRAVAGEIFDSLRGVWLRCDEPNRIAQPGESVLDVVLVEPSYWFFGSHVADVWPSRWLR